MKKIIALVLVIASVLALGSCSFGGVSIKRYSNDVDAVKFFEELSEELDIESGDRWEESLKLTFNSKQKTTSKTKYEGGKTVKTTGEYTVKDSLKYDEKDGLALYETEESVSNKGLNDDFGGNGLTESDVQSNIEYKIESNECYQQDGDDMLVFNNLDKSYIGFDNDENGVQEKVNEIIADYLSKIEGSIPSYWDWDSALDELSGQDDDEDVDVKYYIDKDVFTIVYIEDTDEDKGSYDLIEKTEITIQFVIKDTKITAVSKSKTTTTREYKNYTETETAESTISLEIKFTNVNVSEPNEKRYVEKK